MSNMNTLSSLAMLKVNIDSGRDYLEYLRPYVIRTLIENPPEIVTDANVAKHLKIICGLEIPHRTIQVLLQRLAKAGYLTKEKGVYRVTKDLPASDATEAQADAARHIQAVTRSLIRFAKSGSGRDMDEEVAMESIIAFLSQFSIPCLKSYLRGTTLPTVNGDSDWQVTLVSQFINEMETQPELFASFMKLAQGHMIANALLCPDLNSVSRNYKDVIFYLDTPLLIQLLGLEGTQEKQAIEELISLVGHLEGKFACFTHTFEELKNVIRSSADFIDSPRGRGTIVEEARRSGRSKSDVLLIEAHAAEKIEGAGIRVLQTPPYKNETHEFEISEEIFSSLLEEEINYHNPRAKEYDIKSVRSIYVLRRGIVPFSVEKSKAVLVTNNHSFSKASYDYGRSYEQSRDVSTVITDFSLANTAWLKAPQGAPSLPRKEILAFAYAALRPSAEFWNKVLNEAEKLEASGRISARDHQLLRSDHHVQSELMKLTLGRDDALTEESITRTLERVSSEIRREESERFKESEVARLKSEAELARAMTKAETIKKRIYWRCDSKAGREAFAVSTTLWIILVSTIILGVMKLEYFWGWLALAVSSISAILQIIAIVWDIKPIKVYYAYKKWRSLYLQKKEYKYLTIEDE